MLAENQGHSCLTCETGMSCTEKAADMPGAPSSTICTEAVPSTSPRPVCTTIWSAESRRSVSLNCPVSRTEVVIAGSGEPSGAISDRALASS